MRTPLLIEQGDREPLDKGYYLALLKDYEFRDRHVHLELEIRQGLPWPGGKRWDQTVYCDRVLESDLRAQDFPNEAWLPNPALGPPPRWLPLVVIVDFDYRVRGHRNVVTGRLSLEQYLGGGGLRSALPEFIEHKPFTQIRGTAHG